jgi:hypothetical protein
MALIKRSASPRNRISGDEPVLRAELACCHHQRRPRRACRSTCTLARGVKPAMIIVRAVTSDGPDGQPWPPPNSNTLWTVVRRADGRTLWRAIQLAEVHSAAPDF